MSHYRFVVVALCVLATCVDYITRSNINVAIVSMCNSSDHKPIDNSTQHYKMCPFPKSSSLDANINRNHILASPNVYDWDERTQGIILGAFYLSYQFMQIPAGRLAELFGGKWIIAFGLLGSGLVNLITPLVASSVFLMTLSRVLLGIVQGGIFASCMALLIKWLPMKERSTGFGLANTGACIGIIIGSPLTGYLSDSVYFGGWPSSFYAAGIIAILSFCLFAPLIKSHPRQHSWVSKEELAYITNGNENDEEDTIKSRSLSTPWKEMLMCPAVISTMFAKLCFSFTTLAFANKFPDYMANVLHVSLTDNGLYNGLFSVANGVTLCITGYLSELVIESQVLSKTNTRKVFGFITYFGTGFLYIATPWVGCNVFLVVVLQTIACLLMGFSAGGDTPIPMELTTNFPATLYSMMNFVSCTTGFVGPYLCGLILQSSDDMIYNWNLLFYIAGGVSCLGGLVFLLFTSADVQSWDTPPPDKQCLINCVEDANHNGDLTNFADNSRDSLRD